MRTFLAATIVSLGLAACAGDPPSGEIEANENVDGGIVSERVSGGCVITGCNDQICSDRRVSTACVSSAQNACFAQEGICERSASGSCSWKSSDELNQCLARAAGSGATTSDTSMRSSGSGLGAPPAGSDPPPSNPANPSQPSGSGGCLKTGAFGELCADHEMEGATQYEPTFACYQTTPCERQPGGECGFTPSLLLNGCVWLVMSLNP